MSTPAWFNRLLALCGAGAGYNHVPDEGESLDALRLVVVDVETTGLNLRRDQILSIGAVAVEKGRLKLSESFNRMLKVDARLHKENVLIHGITPTDISDGEPPEQVMEDFLTFLRRAPLVAFHAAFDQKMLEKAIHAHLGQRCRLSAWDLAEWLPALFPEHAQSRRMGLDDWIQALNVPVEQRHNALEDAMATAQLLQMCLARARRKGLDTWGALMAEVRRARRRQQATHA